MGTAITDRTPLGQVKTVKGLLMNQHALGQLDAVRADHLNPERMMRTLALAVSRTPKLADCTPLSLLGALMVSASLGLEPNTPLGLSYLLPFDKWKKGATKGSKPVLVGTEAQLVIGYRGYVQLGHNSSQVAYIDAAIHHADDKKWSWQRGSNAELVHVPGDELGEMLHAYAIFEKIGGGKTWVVWNEGKLVAHRDRYSKGYAADIRNGKKPTDPNVNIWLGDPGLARRKTMIRQLAKMMPMATDAPRAALYDGARADYAGYAMEPDMGSPYIEYHPEDGDGSEIDVEVETDDVKVIEEQTPIEVRGDTGPAQERAPAETKQQAAPRAEAAAPKAGPAPDAATATPTNVSPAVLAARQKAAEARTRAQAQPAAEPEAKQENVKGPEDPFKNDPAPEPAASDDDGSAAEYQVDFSSIADQIRADLEDGVRNGEPIDAIFSSWKNQMAAIKTESPALHDELQAFADELVSAPTGNTVAERGE